MTLSANPLNIRSFVFLTGIFLLATGVGLGQQTSLSGTVTDPAGGVVPGIEVTITNQATLAQRSTISDDTGRYLFTQVRPGTYNVRAELTGFKTAEITDVRLLIDTPITLDISLELGEVTEIVTVQSTSTPLLNTTNASLGNPFAGDQIVNLPLNSRNVVGLLSVQPAVTETGEVSGARSDQSNLTLDGIDVNDQQNGGAFESVLRVTPDSVQEFRVTTLNPTASQGRSSGAQVSLVTRSGTNDFHGSLYHFHRNTVTAANDFFNNRSDIERPALIRNLYGGSLGGPIVKDKAFFFYNFEGRKDRSQSSAVRTVPLPHLGEGKIRFTNTDGEVVEYGPDKILELFPETGGVNQDALAVLADAANRFPANDDSLADGFNIGGFRFNGSTPLNQNTHTAKLDFNLADNQQLFVRGNYQWDNQGFLPNAENSADDLGNPAGIGQFPGAPSPSVWSHPTGIGVGHTWTATASIVNTFRYGLTRQSFSNQGDSADDQIGFRFIYWPRVFERTLNRITPVHNITNDTSWLAGNHTIQFGTNIRFISNQREGFISSYDSAVMNPSFYADSGGVLDIDDVAEGDRDVWRNALTTVLGRYSQFSGRFIFDVDGSLLPPGSPAIRDFSTEEYEFYVEDSWQVTQGLTLNLGLRYSLNTVVAENSGFQVAPTEPLGDFFDRRVAGAAAGNPVNDLIIVDTAGPFYGKPGFYPSDRNNFSPRISAAWSPSFDSGFLRTLFGRNGESVFRGGFSIVYDRIGSALAVTFDNFNQLGFASREQVAANTFDLTTNLGPLFTGFDQRIRSLVEAEQTLTIPDALTFPLKKAADEAQRIETSLDANLTTPINYSWNFSIGREFRGGLFVELSYLGRRGENLLANRDVMHLNNFVDPTSGQSWYEAAGLLADARFNQIPIDEIDPIPFFENLFPDVDFLVDPEPDEGPPIPPFILTPTQAVYGYVANVGCSNPALVALGCEEFDAPDYTYLQLELDDLNPQFPNMFFHPQYAALNTLSTLSKTDYHAFTLTLRERFGETLTWDFNWTWSKTMDWASGGGRLDVGGSGGGFADILNPLDPDQGRSVADFDMQHVINSAWLWRLPFGQGQRWGSGMSGAADAILGGWEINGVFRWNSGLAQLGPFEASRWATNWNAPSNAVRIRDPKVSINKGVGDRPPNMFEDPTFAYQSYRDAKAGEVGDRNVLRGTGFVSFDFGLFKTFNMPYSEGHRITFRWEVFNATNTQRLGEWDCDRSCQGTGQAPNINTPATSFGNIFEIQGRPREMQFGLRYDF